MASFDMVFETERGEFNTTRNGLAILMAERDFVNLCFGKHGEILSIHIWLIICGSRIASSTRSRINRYQIAEENIRVLA